MDKPTPEENKAVLDKLEEAVDSYNLELVRVTESVEKDKEKQISKIIEQRDKIIKEWLDYNILMIKR